MSKIFQILETDCNSRFVGITGDLHTIETLVSDQSLDYDLPTLCKCRSNDNPNLLVNDIKDFKKNFNKKFPFLRKINMKNLLIAGGSISNIVRKSNCYGHGIESDVDFFVYGLDLETATERVKEWLIDILINSQKNKSKKENKSKKKNSKKINRNTIEGSDDEVEDDSENYESDEYNLSEKKTAIKAKHKTSFENKDDKFVIAHYNIVRTKHTISISINNEFKLQLIFRLYKTISEILHGFDLGSSAVGYDGENVYMTSLGKFCHEHSCNIADTTRRSTTYEQRLKKYFERGFNIVLPKMDISKLRINYHKYNLVEVCEMPYMTFGYSNIIGNKIIVEDFYGKHKHNSDYEKDSTEMSNAYGHSLTININSLLSGSDYFYYISSSIDESNIDILTKPPRLNKGQIVDFYDNIRRKISKNKLNINLLKKYITIESINDVLNNLVDKKIDTNDYLNKLIEKQKIFVIERFEKMLTMDHTKINWLAENPTTQISGSFNPIIEDEWKWYGKDYYTFPTEIDFDIF